MDAINTSIDAAIAAAVQQALDRATGTGLPVTPANRTEQYFMTVKQLAERAQISLPNAYNMTHIEGFPLVKMGRKRLIPIAAFEKWLSENTSRVLW